MILGTEVELSATTPRGEMLTLRHPRLSDFDAWRRLREQTREGLQRWEPDWDEAHSDRKAFKSRLALYRRLATAGAAFPFHTYTADGALVGACNLSDVRMRAARSAQIGYWVGLPFQRRGYGLASVEAVLAFAFDRVGLNRVEAAVQVGNRASVGLLERAGLHHEGVARGYLRIGGAWKDHAIYARLASDAVAPNPP